MGEVKMLNIEVKPLREGEPPVLIALMPDKGDFFSAYTIFHNGKKVGRIYKNDVDFKIKEGEYKIITQQKNEKH